MKSLSEIYAKRRFGKESETLEKHTQNVVSIWQSLRDRHETALGMDESFWISSLIAILFHDFGKATRNFQELTLSSPKKQLFSIPAEKNLTDNRIRHEFLSGLYLLIADRDSGFYLKNPASVLAVFTHHKLFQANLFQEQREKVVFLEPKGMLKFLNFAKQQVIEIFGINAYAHFQKIDNQQVVEKLEKILAQPDGMKKLHFNFDKFTKSVLSFKTQETALEERHKYIFHKAILNISDWVASSGETKLFHGLTFQPADIAQKIRQRVLFFEDWAAFQKEAIQPTSIIAIAPTGSGKTEAALLWASQKLENERIIYALPTRVTANAIWRRLTDYFPAENEGNHTAIVHASAHFLRKSLEDNYDNFKYMRDRCFFRNASVCTVDQLLTMGFNVGNWEIRLFHCYRAWVIIDEIHLYAPYTLGLICAMIRALRTHFQTRFFIMSATMPSKLKNLLSDYLDNLVVITDKSLLDAARNTFWARDAPVDAFLNEIKTKVLKNHKVLLVVNTVNEAIRLYNSPVFAGLKKICYHSRFITQDRPSKEGDILAWEAANIGGVLLICTQVCEVSLDIDYDFLYTENAPIDAIIQRAGRVNRKRKKIGTEVIVCWHQPVTEKYIYPSERLKKTFELLTQYRGMRLTERALTDLVENVYENMVITEDKNFIEGLNKYDKLQAELNYLWDLDAEKLEKAFTREGLDTKTVIPACYETLLKEASIEEKTKYELSVSKRFARNFKCTKDAYQFEYLDAPYSYEKGLETFQK